MRDFFVNQWLNFKENWRWYILWLFLVQLSFYGFSYCFDCLSLEFGAEMIFGVVNLNFTLDYFWMGALVGLLISYFSSRFALHIYSYYIYTGKNNWYKFFREREKEHKKEDKIAYEEYLKSQKVSRM